MQHTCYQKSLVGNVADRNRPNLASTCQPQPERAREATGERLRMRQWLRARERQRRRGEVSERGEREKAFYLSPRYGEKCFLSFLFPHKSILLRKQHIRVVFCESFDFVTTISFKNYREGARVRRRSVGNYRGTEWQFGQLNLIEYGAFRYLRRSRGNIFLLISYCWTKNRKDKKCLFHLLPDPTALTTWA